MLTDYFWVSLSLSLRKRKISDLKHSKIICQISTKSQKYQITTFPTRPKLLIHAFNDDTFSLFLTNQLFVI